MAKHFRLDDLTKGNVWSMTEADLGQMFIDAIKHDTFADGEKHYMNIIRPVFDVKFINSDDELLVDQLRRMNFEIFSYSSDGKLNAVGHPQAPD